VSYVLFMDLSSHYETAQLREKYAEIYHGLGDFILAPDPSGVEVVPGVGPFGLGVLRGTGDGQAETRRLGPWYQRGAHELLKVPGWGVPLGTFTYRNGTGTFFSEEAHISVSGEGAVVVAGGAGEVCRSADGIVPIGSFFTLEWQIESDGFYVPVGAGSAAAQLNGVEVCSYAGPMGGVGEITGYRRELAEGVEGTGFVFTGFPVTNATDPFRGNTLAGSGSLRFVALNSTGPDPDHTDAVRFPPATPETFWNVRYVQATMEAYMTSGTFADLALMGYHSDVPEWAPEEEERTFTRAQFHHDDGLSGDPMFYWGGSFSDAAVYQSPWTDTEFNLTGWGTRSEPFETFGGLGTATGIWLEVICMQGTGGRVWTALL
jgi:hypothetical protein